MRPSDDELRAYLKAHAAWRSRYRQRDWEDVREFENEYGSAIVGELLERRATDAKTKEEPEWMEM